MGLPLCHFWCKRWEVPARRSLPSSRIAARCHPPAGSTALLPLGRPLQGRIPLRNPQDFAASCTRHAMQLLCHGEIIFLGVPFSDKTSSFSPIFASLLCPHLRTPGPCITA